MLVKISSWGRHKKKIENFGGNVLNSLTPYPPPPNWDKKKLGLFAKLLDTLPPSGIWDITVTKLGSGNYIKDIFISF